MATPDKVYIRFVCYQQVGGQRQRLGIFQAVDEARASSIAPPWATSQVGRLYGWFKENLSVPRQFSSGGWKGGGQPGLSWFKPTAKEHVQQMLRLKLALEACGIAVDILTTRDPGKVVWQDEHQLVAEPGTRKF